VTETVAGTLNSIRKGKTIMKRFFSMLLLTLLSLNLSQAQTKNRPDQLQMSTYVVGLLYKGPIWTAEKTPKTESLQAGHMANIKKMAENQTAGRSRPGHSGQPIED